MANTLFSTHALVSFSAKQVSFLLEEIELSQKVVGCTHYSLQEENDWNLQPTYYWRVPHSLQGKIVEGDKILVQQENGQTNVVYVCELQPEIDFIPTCEVVELLETRFQ